MLAMKTSDLELGASQALFAAQMMVDAIHSRGFWEMQWGSIKVPAVRSVDESGVVFRAVFPEACWLSPPDSSVVILLDGEIRGMRRIDHPGDTAFMVSWSLAASVSA